MARLGLKTLTRLVLLVIAVGVGYLAGIRQGQISTDEWLRREAEGNLTQRIEALSLLRIGDTPAAIERLEAQADQLTLGLARNADDHRAVLAMAKAYRKIAPPPASREKELAAVFAPLPDLRPGQCSTALRKLMLSAEGRAADK